MTERKVGFNPELLRALRRAEKPFLSQQALGDAIGVKQKVISAWETGEDKPNYEHLGLLADYFKTTTDFLLGVTTERDKKSDLREKPGLIEKFEDAIAKKEFGDAAEIFARLVKGEK